MIEWNWAIVFFLSTPRIPRIRFWTFSANRLIQVVLLAHSVCENELFCENNDILRFDQSFYKCQINCIEYNGNHLFYRFIERCPANKLAAWFSHHTVMQSRIDIYSKCSRCARRLGYQMWVILTHPPIFPLAHKLTILGRYIINESDRMKWIKCCSKRHLFMVE